MIKAEDFLKQVRYNKKKLVDVSQKQEVRLYLDEILKSRGMSNEDFKEEFLENSPIFIGIVKRVASQVSVGKIVSPVYAGIVAFVADRYGIEYKVMSGLCFTPDYKREFADKDKESIKKYKADGNEHPFYPNHTYLMINDTCYEYFNGYVEGIEKVDVVEV